MWGTASWAVDRWLLPVWAMFASANIALMFAAPGVETIPFHFVWISLAVIYGWQVWSLRWTYFVVVVVAVVTCAPLLVHAKNKVIGWEESTEVPLMSLVFLTMVWHVRRRMAATETAAALAESERRMRESHRRFVRLASHELRTPVTVARGYTELLRRSASSGSQIAADAEVVLDELDKLEGISSRLLTLAQIDDESRLQPDVVDIDLLLRRMVKRWGPAAARRWSLDTHAGTLIGDVERLETALDSILDNAVRFTADGGLIALSAVRDHQSVLIEIRDDGIGIPEGEEMLLFERFRRLDSGSGTGIGLAVVKAAVEMHGGTVSARRATPHGSVFSLRLPLTGPNRAREGRQPVFGDPRPGGRQE